MRKFNVAVVGATGAVGEELFRVLEEYEFPVNKMIRWSISWWYTRLDVINKYRKNDKSWYAVY